MCRLAFDVEEGVDRCILVRVFDEWDTYEDNHTASMDQVLEGTYR